MEAGAVLSLAIETMGPVADTLELDRRTWLTHYVVDNRIIDAALALVADEGNAPEARIYALRTLIWQKAPGQLVTTKALTARPPKATESQTSSSYTTHYYTGLGYGTGEYPWPVLGMLPDENYIARMDSLVQGTTVASGSPRVASIGAWLLWYSQDSELAALLQDARRREGPSTVRPADDAGTEGR